MSLGILAVIEQKLKKIDKSKLSIEGFDEFVKSFNETISLVKEFDNPDYEGSLKMELQSKIYNLNYQNFDLLRKLGDKKMDLSPEEKDVYSILLAAKEPLDYIAEKRDQMRDKKSIEALLTDFSFARNYFGKRETTYNPENYQKGNINFNDGDIEAAIRQYRISSNEYKMNMEKALKTFSKDEVNPLKTFGEKLSFVDMLLNETGEKNQPLSATRDVYDQMNLIANGDITDLRIRNFFSSSFFSETLGFALDKTFISSNIEKLNTNDTAKEIIKDISSGLRPFYSEKSKKNGKEVEETHYLALNDKLLETFDVSSELIRNFYDPIQIMEEESNPEKLIGEGKPFHDIYTLYKGFNQRILDSINKKNGSTIPTKADLSQFLKDAGNRLSSIDEQAILNHKGGGINHILLSFLGTIHSLQRMCPGMTNETQPIIDSFNKRLLSAYKNERNYILQAVPNSQKAMKAIDSLVKGVRELYFHNVIPEDEYYRTLLSKMAESPDYCNHIMSSLEDDMTRMVQKEQEGLPFSSELIISKGKETAFQGVDIKHSSSFPEEKRNGAFYRLYLAGKQLQQEQIKIEAFGKQKADFSDKVTGKVNPEILNIRKTEEYNDENLKGIHSYIDNMLGSKAFKDLGYIKPSEFAKSVTSPEGIKNMIKTGSQRRAQAVDAKLDPDSPEIGKKQAKLEARAESVEKMNNYFNGLDKDTIKTLSQNSSVFFKKNSPEYTAIGDAIARINTAKEAGVGPDINDYKNLYEACSTYMTCHHTNPTTKIGKQRFAAAAKIAANLSVHIENSISKTEKQAILRENASVQMMRSKVFRDEYKNASSRAFVEMSLYPKDASERTQELMKYRQNVSTRCENIEQRIKNKTLIVPEERLNTKEKLDAFKEKMNIVKPKEPELNIGQNQPDQPELNNNINIL